MRVRSDEDRIVKTLAERCRLNQDRLDTEFAQLTAVLFGERAKTA